MNIFVMALLACLHLPLAAEGTKSRKLGSPAKMNRFVSDLMAKMTLDEKAGQLVQYTGDMSVTGNTVRENFRADIEKGFVGSMLNVYTPQFSRELQKLATEKPRLKIPLLFGYDVIHGHRTVFPIPLAEAATWDPDLAEKSARIAATEAAADGIHWTFAPMLDISRDPRWGRVSEGSGEDPYLGARLGVARVRGFQGEDLSRPDTILATVKHFAAYGAPEGGRDYNTVSMGPRELMGVYMKPYEAAVAAGAATVMTAFNEIDGVPATGNAWLLNDVLRKRWGFKGLVITDYNSINEMINHGVVANEPEAGRLAIKSGVDIDMQSANFGKYLVGDIKSGKVPKSVLDAAVRRVLEAKYKLGLFEDPFRYIDENRAQATMMKPEYLAHAREVARRSFVLLKNDKDLLPLKRQGTIALIGPMVDNLRDQIGNWSAGGDYKKVVSLAEGMKTVAGGKVKILKATGANLLEERGLVEALNRHGGCIEMDPRGSGDMIEEAVRIAQKADVVVLALGEAQGMSGEAASRTHLRIPKSQRTLLDAINKVGKPIVLLVYAGRPLILGDEAEQVGALMMTWFPGHQSGLAVADVLFGDFNPSGKLPMSFPRSEGQIPVYYNAKNTGRPFKAGAKYTSQYLDSPNEPLYPFGFGLSYTRFEISEPKLNQEKIRPGGKLTVTVQVTNKGSRAGEETVQLYVRDLVGSVTRPVKELRGFKKVALQPGESREVTMMLTTEDLKFFDKNMRWVAEPGEFRIMVGASSDSLKGVSFHLL
jgi:beta-glucosidase